MENQMPQPQPSQNQSNQVSTQINQQFAEPTLQTKKKRRPMIALAVFVLLAIGLVVGIVAFGKPLFNKKLTVEEGQRIAEGINPYIPDGYSILHKAKLVEFSAGGVIFDTQLVSGENKISIILQPGETLSCDIETERRSGKEVCVLDTPASKGIKWIQGKITYQVLTLSPGVTMDVLEKIVDSL